MKQFTKLLLLTAFIALNNIIVNAQSVTTTNETGDSLCNGSAILNNSFLYSSWLWTLNTDTLQVGGDTITGLCNGIYILNYMDSIGSNSYTFLIGTDSVNSCANFNASVTATNETTNGGCNGTATVSATGGTTPYSYIWSDSSTTVSASGLCAGTYTVIVTDANACNLTITAVVNTDSSSNPGVCNNFMVTATAVNETSNGVCDGSAVASATGGNGAYSYLWSDSSTTSSISNLCSGIYTITVVDDSACSATYSITVGSDSSAVSNPLSGYVLTTDVSVNGTCDGSAQTYVFGGSSPYIYYYSNGSTSSIADSLCAGVETVMITDANGDTLMLTYLISNPSNTVSNPTFQDSTINDTLVNYVIENCVIDYNSIDSAFIDIYNFFNTDSVTVIWAVYDINGVTYITDTYYIGGGNGVYTIELSLICSQKATGDFLKARDQIYFNTSLVSAVGIAESNNIEANVYPNPFNDNITIQFSQIDNYTVSLFDINGKLIINKNFNETSIIKLTSDNLANGLYVLKIKNDKSIMTTLLTK